MTGHEQLLTETGSGKDQQVSLKELRNIVDDLSDETRKLERQKFETIGSALAKTSIGSLWIIDNFINVMGLSNSAQPNTFSLIIGAAIVVFGLRDAGGIRYDFREARRLRNERDALASSLEYRYQQAILGIPDAEFLRGL